MRPLNAKILAALLPNARLGVVHGGGHLFMTCQADVTAAMVKDFLDTLPPSCSAPTPAATGNGPVFARLAPRPVD